MIRTIAFVGFAAALTVAQGALAQAPSGFGTEGPQGQRLHHQAVSSFQRGWNNYNESKYRAAESAEWLRQHNRYPF